MSAENNLNDLTLLPPIEQRMVNLWLTGMKVTEIASMLHVHDNTVRTWLRKDMVRERIDALQNEEQDYAKQRLRANRYKAVDKMVSLIDSPIDGVALQATKMVLDITGVKPSQEKKEVNVNITTYEQNLESLINKTIRKEAIEVEYTDK